VDDDAKQRAERRRSHAADWPIRKYALGEEPAVDPLDRSTVDERLASMWPLARAAYRLAGVPLPTYSRAQMPGIMIRKSQSP